MAPVIPLDTNFYAKITNIITASRPLGVWVVNYRVQLAKSKDTNRGLNWSASPQAIPTSGVSHSNHLQGSASVSSGPYTFLSNRSERPNDIAEHRTDRPGQ